jgi:hypothetical protein
LGEIKGIKLIISNAGGAHHWSFCKNCLIKCLCWIFTRHSYHMRVTPWVVEIARNVFVFSKGLRGLYITHTHTHTCAHAHMRARVHTQTRFSIFVSFCRNENFTLYFVSKFLLKFNITIFWDVSLCNPVDIYRLFGGKCCFRLQVGE